MSLLTVNDECSTPGTVVCFEVATNSRQCETNAGNSTLSFRVAAASSGRIDGGKMTRVNSERFNTVDEFWEWLNWTRHAKMPVWLFGRNIGTGLTLLGFWQRLTDGKMTINRRHQPGSAARQRKANGKAPEQSVRGLIIADDPPTAIVCFDKSGWRSTCLDIRNYLDESFDYLARTSNIDLPEIPLASSSDEEWFRHCECRVKVLMKTVEKLSIWHREQEFGKFGFTISGCALAAFRHRFMMHEIDMPDDVEQRDYEREGCYQGRVSCCWAGKIHNGTYTAARDVHSELAIDHELPRGPFHIVDARSFYGAISAWHEVPVKLESKWSGHDTSCVEIDSLDESCLATVLIDSKVDAYPVHHGDRQLYVPGRFWTVLCGPELARAVRSGHVVKVGKGCKYRMKPALSAYASAIWQQRVIADRDGNELVSTLCKQLLARLHGKFQQRNKRWIDLPDRVSVEPWYRWTEINCDPPRVTRMRSIGWDVQQQGPASDSPICFPAIGGWVTSWGREWLRDWMKAAGPDQCLYCSTDSLIVTDDGLNRLNELGLIQPDILGGLKLDMSASNIDIRGPNNYTFGDSVVISGRYAEAEMIDRSHYAVDVRQTLSDIVGLSGPSTIEVNRSIKTMPISSVDGTIGPYGWIIPRFLTVNDQRAELDEITDDYYGYRQADEAVQPADLVSMSGTWSNIPDDDWSLSVGLVDGGQRPSPA